MSIFSSGFLPHGYCLNWQPTLIWLYSIFNGTIALAYYSIPLSLLYFVKKRRDLSFQRVVVLFSLFILACGTTHILHILLLWQPIYKVQISLDGITALLSLATATLLWKQLPLILSIPNSKQLKTLNQHLNDEIKLRIETEQDIRKNQQLLEQRVVERTQELENANLLLQESQKRLKTIINNVHAVIWTMDNNRNITFISDYVAQLLGYPVSSLNDAAACFELIHPRDQRNVINAIDAAFSERISNNLKCRIKHFDGSWYWISTSITPVKLKDASLQIVGVIHDAHQDYLQQEKIRAVNKQLDKKIKDAIAENIQKEKVIAGQARFAAMGEMVGNIAHQWRQPLNSLSLIIEDIHEAYNHNQLSDSYLQESEKKALQQIDKMSSTIDLFQSRLNGKIQKVLFSINDVIDDTTELVKDYLTSKGIELTIYAENNFLAYGAPEELNQILQNIIANSRDAILEHATVEKRISIFLRGDLKHSLIEITDTGGGIEESIIEKVFDPFFSRKNTGRGIGLYMVKQLVEDSFSGSITLANCNGGTKATISLPNKDG